MLYDPGRSGRWQMLAISVGRDLMAQPGADQRFHLQMTANQLKPIEGSGIGEPNDSVIVGWPTEAWLRARSQSCG